MERITRNAPTLLLALALAAAAAMTLAMASGLTFYADTWELLMNRRDPSVETLLQPHNEHLVLIPVLLEQLILRLFGMTSAMPEYVLLTLFLVGSAALLYVYVRRRVGPWPALFAAILILTLGPAWEVLLWPFEITFCGPVFFGLATLLALEREDRRGDVAACVFLTVSLGFSSLAVPFIVGAAVALLQGGRGTWLRRAYVVALPIALYAAWYVGWGHDAQTQMSLHNVLASPRFVVDEVSVAAGSVFEFRGNPLNSVGGMLWGRLVLVALIAAVAYRLWRKPGVFPGLWPVAAAAAANWFLTAFNDAPGRDPTASRYQYVGAIFILMILANLFQGVRLNRWLLGAGAALTFAAVAMNVTFLDAGRDLLRRQAVLTKADLGALEIARGSVEPTFQMNPEVTGSPTLINIFAGPYLEAVDEYGSPAYSPAELEAASGNARRWADVVLARALPVSTTIRLGGYEEPGRGGRSCVAAGAGARSELAVAPGLTRIELAPGPRAEFALHRFGTGRRPARVGGAPGGSVTLLRIPRDLASQPWFLHVDARQPARVCR